MNPGPAPSERDSALAETQRQRILCAAQHCFIERGFHAASMLSIAEAAGMSVGLLYRYFENKNAIVLAIIDRQLGEGRAQLARLHSSSDLAAELTQAFARWKQHDESALNVALFLEMSVESSRDPQVAEALRASDATMLEELRAWMQRGRDEGGLGLAAETIANRAFLLQCFVNGLMVCAMRCGADTGNAGKAIEKVVDRLLTP